MSLFYHKKGLKIEKMSLFSSKERVFFSLWYPLFTAKRGEMSLFLQKNKGNYIGKCPVKRVNYLSRCPSVHMKMVWFPMYRVQLCQPFKWEKHPKEWVTKQLFVNILECWCTHRYYWPRLFLFKITKYWTI